MPRRKEIALSGVTVMVFALFSLSPIEIIILGGLCFTPAVVGIILLVVLRSRPRSGPTDRELALEDENQRLRERVLEEENARLREENARLKKGPPSQDITP
jgi:hypothetical protein